MSGKAHKVFPATVAAFWIYVVLDFAIHAVVLVSWWRDHGTYSLSLLELAQRIPIGYSSFAIYCTGLCVLLASRQFEPLGVLSGLRIGVVVGIVYGLMFALGVYSITRIPMSFLILGPVSTAICSAGAGGTGAWVLIGVQRWRRVGLIVLGGVILLIIAIILQNLLQNGSGSTLILSP